MVVAISIKRDVAATLIRHKLIKKEGKGEFFIIRMGQKIINIKNLTLGDEASKGFVDPKMAS